MRNGLDIREEKHSQTTPSNQLSIRRVAQAAVDQRLAPPQTRTCGTTASGSSRNGLAMPIYYPRLFRCLRFPGHCCPSGVSQPWFHSPMRRFPTDRLPSARFAALPTVLLAHYDFRQPIPRASFVTSRSVFRLVVLYSLTRAGQPPPSCRAFGLPVGLRIRLS
jgi:hypothetical protein